MNRRLPEQDERRVGDLPFSGVQLRSRAQPELVEQDSRNRIGVRIVRHLRLPVPGNGPAVQFRSADFPVHIGRDLLVMIRGERPRKLDLDGLGCRERGVQACALPGDRLVPLVRLIRQEDSLGLTVRTEGDRRRGRALTAEARKYARKPLPDLRQRMHLDHSRVSHVTSVLKLVQHLHGWECAALGITGTARGRGALLLYVASG